MNTDAFTSGAIVRVHRQGELRWVVVAKVADRKWRVIARDAIDRSGRVFRTSRTCGEGDMVLLEPAPTFVPGTPVSFNGGGDTFTGVPTAVRLPHLRPHPKSALSRAFLIAR